MYQYRSYAERLRQLAQLSSGPNAVPDKPRLHRALNGEADDVLVERVPVEVLRRSGAFFTPITFAEKLASRVAGELHEGKSVLDPACGAGDLLLACGRKLPLAADLISTLDSWGERLHGFDIHEEFILATKARLVLLAVARGAPAGSSPTLRLESLFPNIRQGDFLAQQKLERLPGCVIINPPFQRAPTPRGVTWSSGLVSRAALFLDRCLDLVPPSTRIAALLPDVLRSGSRYTNWRESIATRASLRRVETLGTFNERADVDVFLVTFTTGIAEKPTSRRWFSSNATQAKQGTIESICTVRVGPVVPFRDPKSGPSRPYVTTADLPAGKVASRFPRRKYAGEAFAGPFVAVRRTSRPTDPCRAVATIVRSSRKLAVENHLIVLLPNGRTLTECKSLLRVLRDPRTSQWLNERICCRHLTTAVLKQLPLWPKR
jgi:hypothetical protein